MTATAPGRPAPAQATPESHPVKGGKWGIPERPQVNLLPPEVIRRRQVARAQRQMLWAVIATIAVAVLAYMGAFLVRAEAAARHDEALATADDLTMQMREYSPVIQVINEIARVQGSREYVLGDEVNWPSYSYALAAVLPADVTIDTLSVSLIAPGQTLQEGADDLTRDAIGMMNFTATSATLPDASDWIDAIESVTGLEDANLQSSELTDESGAIAYSVVATVQITEDATANRSFSDDESALLGGNGTAEAEEGE